MTNLKAAELTVRVVTLSRLYREILLLHGDVNLVISRRNVRLVRDIAQAVLIAEFFVQRSVNLIDALFLRNFKKTPACFSGYLFENFFPIVTRFLGISM